MKLDQAIESIRLITQLKNQNPTLIEASLVLVQECKQLELKNKQLRIQRDFLRSELAKLGHRIFCDDIPLD